MGYQLTSTEIEGALIIEPEVHGDSRGFFMESFNQRDFDAAAGSGYTFVQDNHSRSSKGVLRGLHFQDPLPQGKLVRVLRGRVWDVAVDMRRQSKSFGRWLGVELSEDRPALFWLPPGLAHGFVVLSEFADVLYKTTDYYSPTTERCIRWDCPDLAIAWPDPGVPITLSAKDKAGLSFREALT